MLQRRQQAQHGALVEPCAVGQFAQRQRAISGREDRHQAHRPVDRGDAACGGIGVCHGFGDGFTGHGQLRRCGGQQSAYSIL
ncbi:hypothetical protein G6F68_018871 [Rhizopus microsporus]|nr:hypothetical protein G6F31_019367 [Rhizopus arrhizus]KAG1236265.1 hypothetical protein G6F68_018871 [Rhizopus microsporus]